MKYLLRVELYLKPELMDDDGNIEFVWKGLPTKSEGCRFIFLTRDIEESIKTIPFEYVDSIFICESDYEDSV